jgi:O-antigen/teichoic acid export membrane protein
MSGAHAALEADPRRRSLRARIAGNFAWGMVAEMSAKGALFLVTLRLAGVLGAENFGEFSFLQTIFVFLWMGVDLGLNMYATREVARNPGDVAPLLADLTAMRLALALALGGLALAGFSLRADPATTYLTAGFALYLVVRAVQPDWLLRGLERYRALALVNVATAALQLAITWLLIDGPEDYALSSLPWLASYLIGTAGVVFALRRAGIPVWRRGASSGPRGWWRHWSESIHFTLSSGVSTLYQNLPLLYLYWQGSAQQTGLFAAPFRLVIALLFVASVFPMTLYPVIADLETRGKGRALARLVAAAALATTVATGVVSAITAIWAESIVTMLYGDEYLAGAPTLRWLSLFLLLRAVRAVFVRVVGGMGHQRRYSAVSAASVAALLALLGSFSWLGIDPLVAAPVALAVTEALVLLAMIALTVSALRAMPPETRPAA